jgi:cbb3-type cytochrome oxidase maturation protein
MDIIYILVPLSIGLILIAMLIFFWAVRSGQFDDMDSPAHRILFDQDETPGQDFADVNPANSIQADTPENTQQPIKSTTHD